MKTLFELYKNPQKKQKTFGIIIDATCPYKTEKTKDYITKLKIIDETLNIDTDTKDL